jgi:hypothetical protein
MNRIRNLFLRLFIITLLVSGCDKSNTPEDVLTPTKTNITPTNTAITPNMTPFTPLTATLTPTIASPSPTMATATPTMVTPITDDSVDLGYCYQKADQNICITSINQSNNNSLYMVLYFDQNDKAESYYLLLSGEKYGCVPVAGYSNLYYCPDLPFVINRTVWIKFYSTTSSHLLAKGKIYLAAADILKPTPTSRPTAKPSNPYNP